MVTPEQILKKAKNLYPAFVHAWLAGEEFFPCVIPCNKQVPGDIVVAQQATALLENQSKAKRGYGYSIEWQEKKFRRHGRNRWPKQIFFADQSGFLRYLGKQREFNAFTRAVELVRQRFPKLETWLIEHPMQLMKDASKIDGLLDVLQCLIDNPRPMCFLRELPVPVDTKFIERHKRVLGPWLDLLLPSEAVFSHENRFERRYGLKTKGDYFLVRLLDPQLQHELQVPFDDFQLPLDALKRLEPQDGSVFVVENEVPLRTLPPLPRTIAFGGLGDAATLLDYLPWMETTQITYWGDLDVEGLEGLSTFRARLPQTRSFMMDATTLDEFFSVATHGKGKPLLEPVHLKPDELAAFLRCREENLRIEQEQIPQAAVLAALVGTDRRV